MKQYSACQTNRLGSLIIDVTTLDQREVWYNTFLDHNADELLKETIDESYED